MAAPPLKKYEVTVIFEPVLIQVWPPIDVHKKFPKYEITKEMPMLNNRTKYPVIRMQVRTLDSAAKVVQYMRTQPGVKKVVINKPVSRILE